LLAAGGTINEFSAAAGSNQICFTQAHFTLPTELFMVDRTTGAIGQLTTTNADLLAKIESLPPESVTVSGTGGTPVQMWIVKPPGFDPAKKYPLVFWVHGGPQIAYLDGWSTRWNSQVWAAQGYVIALPNPRGSTGFGQKFTGEISRDWNGKVYTDLLACLGYLEKLPYIDTKRMAAAGASYGGYMMNWFEGHLDKFRCIVNHDGVYNLDSMYGSTEEVWFDEWEHGKAWEASPADKASSPHLYAASFKTPMLIIHNDLDFRVPVTEGLQVFTALQRQGVPSKLLMFPDEGHWVLKPQNSELWHQTIFDWLAVYLK
jgi:dipeptidyl aminopeptidase/acylaminoacyl peptidase